MSSQMLYDAVQLAQAGRREEARQMFWQVVQGDPNNEVAWLWLASVAADQAEYQKALNEVLRINPANPQARDLLAQVQQQYGAPPQAQAPAQYPPAQPQAPSSYAPAQPQPPTQAPGYYSSQPVPPPPPPPQYAGQPQQTPGGGFPVPSHQAPAPSRVVYVEHERRRRGCLGCGCLGGCVQSCLLVVFIFIILPVVACGALSYTGRSLGPFDTLAVYLPDEFGRKDVQFEVKGRDNTRYTVSVSVPRSWYAATANNAMWEVWRDGLTKAIPFESQGDTWTRFKLTPNQNIVLGEVNLDEVPAENATVAILETNPAVLTNSGAPGGLVFVGITDGPAQARRDEKVAVGGRIFKDFAQPDQMHFVSFTTPVEGGRVAEWLVAVPEDQYNTFKSDIARIIETAKVKPGK